MLYFELISAYLRALRGYFSFTAKVAEKYTQSRAKIFVLAT